MSKRIFPIKEIKPSDQLVKGKSRYAQSTSSGRTVITPSRVSKRAAKGKGA